MKSKNKNNKTNNNNNKKIETKKNTGHLSMK